MWQRTGTASVPFPSLRPSHRGPRPLRAGPVRPVDPQSLKSTAATGMTSPRLLRSCKTILPVPGRSALPPGSVRIGEDRWEADHDTLRRLGVVSLTLGAHLSYTTHTNMSLESRLQQELQLSERSVAELSQKLALATTLLGVFTPAHPFWALSRTSFRHLTRVRNLTNTHQSPIHEPPTGARFPSQSPPGDAHPRVCCARAAEHGAEAPLFPL